MNKTDDKFCPECGHHLYINGTQYHCQECDIDVDLMDVLTTDEAQPTRERYDSQAEEG
jgi:hypothetical protein